MLINMFSPHNGLIINTKNMKKIIFSFCLPFLFLSFLFAQTPRKEIIVAPALSDFPVAFSLLTHGNKQFVAFYDPQHRMTVASRDLNDDKWTFQVLPSQIGWDGHNSIAMQIDGENQIHLSGNMHVDSLVYFRTTVPLDITSFKELNYMTGKDESRVTYPAFMKGPDDSFIFHYRDGGSGEGNEIFNVYDVRTHAWRRLLDKPLTDGENQMNAYMSGPSLGPDGYYHLVWVWRDSYLCETNHHLSYARSRNLTDWESVDGKHVDLPLTIHQKELWVDPVPPKAGLINGGAKMGFDSKNRLLITYHKFDETGNNQAYIARFDRNRWEIRQLSNWDYRWYFSGGGGIAFEINVNGAQKNGDNSLRIGYDHIKHGTGYWLVDENTLNVIKTVTVKSTAKEVPKETTPALLLSKRKANDFGSVAGKKFFLEWETFPQNRDTIRTGIKAPPTMLKVIEETESNQ